MALMLLLDQSSNNPLASLPDPMKLDPIAIAWVMGLVVILHFYLKAVFFKPIGKVMDDRERDMAAGSDTKAKALALVEERQKEHADKLKALRAKAYEHRKALADAAAKEKQAVLDAARAEAKATKDTALSALEAQKQGARMELLTQVETLSQSMVQHLLVKQA